MQTSRTPLAVRVSDGTPLAVAIELRREQRLCPRLRADLAAHDGFTGFTLAILRECANLRNEDANRIAPIAADSRRAAPARVAHRLPFDGTTRD
jgi:hypothetical protein